MKKILIGCTVFLSGVIYQGSLLQALGTYPSSILTASFRLIHAIQYNGYLPMYLVSWLLLLFGAWLMWRGYREDK